MKYASLSQSTAGEISTYILHLELGEDIHNTIQQFCIAHHIANATIEGIGSVQNPTLAHYSIETKQFIDRDLPGIYEITSLLGNVALVDNQPFAHLHATVSDPKMNVLGGHLVRGECSATLELIIHTFPSRHAKTHDDTIGLKVWDFKTE